jgi:hypothetical protein
MTESSAATPRKNRISCLFELKGMANAQHKSNSHRRLVQLMYHFTWTLTVKELRVVRWFEHVVGQVNEELGEAAFRSGIIT